MRFKRILTEENLVAADPRLQPMKKRYNQERYYRTTGREDPDQYESDIIDIQSKIRDENGTIVPSKYLSSKDEKITKIVNMLLNSFTVGTLLIEFARNPKDGTDIKLDVEFKGDCIWLFSKGKPGKYDLDEEGPIQRFSNIDEFITSMTKSLYAINQDVDKKAVRENLFDPDAFKHVVQQMLDFIREYPRKANALNYRNENWDMEIKFKRSMKRMSGDTTDNDVSTPWVIYPSISGENKWGRIIAPDEVETYDPTLWEKIITQISSAESSL